MINEKKLELKQFALQFVGLKKKKRELARN